MNAKQLLGLAAVIVLLPGAVLGAAQPSVYDLAGHWESTMEFGKFKFDLAIKVAKTAEGKLEAKVDIPEQGAKDIPVSAMLFNYPAVRWEIDPFNTAFNGKINAAGTEIEGAFEEGPGGRPIPLTFKRIDPSKRVEPERRYTFAPGEARDLRGYWEGTISGPRDGDSRVGLKIGRAADGSFAATLDLLDQGARDLPATTVAWTNGTAKLEWKLFQITFDGKLAEDGNQLSGDWKGRGSSSTVAFRRLDQPATVLPAGVSFLADPNRPQDIRGEWGGSLAVQGASLRLVIKIGQTPDGTFAGTLTSPDQGPGEVPITSLGYTNPVVRIEWKGIRGVFKGTVNPEGTRMDGSWEQGGPGLELKLARAGQAPKATQP